MRQARRKGLEPPAWALEPELRHGLQLYHDAFWHLHTCRHYAGGPIPHNEIRRYAADLRLSPSTSHRLTGIIRVMDNALSDSVNKKKK